VSYIIAENTRNEWEKLASASGIAYSTIVGQHIYDLQGLIKVLSDELTELTQPAKTGLGTNNTSLNSSSPLLQPTQPNNTSPTKQAELTRKLSHYQEQLAAYQLEQQHAI